MLPTLHSPLFWRQHEGGTGTGHTDHGVGALAVLAILLLGLAYWVSPARVARMVSLDWEVGNMAPVVQGLRVLLAGSAILLWINRSAVVRAASQVNPADYVRVPLLVMVSTAFALGGAEVGLRLAQFPFTGSWVPPETVIARFDPELGWSYIPALTTTQTIAGRTVPLYFDDSGIRVGEPHHVWRRGAPSILFIGDSFTFGHGVSYDETFAARVEGLLGDHVQTVDLGVQAYGTDQALLSLERYIGRFDTRFVVYTYIPDHVRRNDNYDRRLFFRSGRWPGSKPLFGVRDNGTVFERKRPVPIEKLGNFHLLQIAQLAWVRWGPRPDRRLTTALIRELRRYCDERHVRLLVVDWTWNTGPGDPGIFKGTGAEVLDVGIGAPKDWATWRIPGDGHPSPAAHARVATLIARRIEAVDTGLVGGSSSHLASGSPLRLGSRRRLSPAPRTSVRRVRGGKAGASPA